MQKEQIIQQARQIIKQRIYHVNQIIQQVRQIIKQLVQQYQHVGQIIQQVRQIIKQVIQQIISIIQRARHIIQVQVVQHVIQIIQQARQFIKLGVQGVQHAIQIIQQAIQFIKQGVQGAGKLTTPLKIKQGSAISSFKDLNKIVLIIKGDFIIFIIKGVDFQLSFSCLSLRFDQLYHLIFIKGCLLYCHQGLIFSFMVFEEVLGIAWQWKE